MPDDLTRLIIYIALIIIVPLIPAVPIFWIFPDTRVISWGPFKGQRVRMTGAFAGYFVLVIMIGGFITSYDLRRPRVQENISDTWTITGKMQCKGAPQDLHYRLAVISIVPLKQTIDDADGSFSLEKVRIPNKDGLRQCSLYFSYDRYAPRMVSFGQDTPFDNDTKAYSIEINDSQKTINIKRPVVLEPNSASTAVKDVKQ